MHTAVETSGDRSCQDALGEVQLAINSTVNRVTKHSPIESMISKIARSLNLMASEEGIHVDIEEVRGEATHEIEKSGHDKKRFDSPRQLRIHFLWETLC